MSNWTPEQQNATSFIALNYVSYYLSDLTTFAGRLSKGDTIIVRYIPEKDAMQINGGSKPSANGSYIIDPYDSYGMIILDINASKTTTEAKTTVDKNTGNVTPQNTNSDGGTYGSDTDLLSEVIYLDDAFIESASAVHYTSSQEYYDNLQYGLRVKDLRGILGMPHQFLPTTDPRIDAELKEDGTYGYGDEGGFGRVYSEKIIKNIPLLLMTPGIPSFMAKYSDAQRDTMLEKLLGWNPIGFDSIFKNNKSGKYYSLKYAYTDYFYYVNAMLRSAAYFLEIDNETIDQKPLGSYNWLYDSRNGDGEGVYSNNNLVSFLGPYTGAVAFYADAGSTVDDSFGNSTTESQLASSLNNVSDQAREINFIIGNAAGATGIKVDELLGTEDIGARVDSLTKTLGGGNIFSNILGKAQTIFAGGRLIFPEIWSDSSFSRSYSCSMKLVSPSGDKLSIYLNILVPIYHLLGFALPREAANQAYFSPFLVRAYYKGLFNVDMGIIPGLSITKGEEGEWTVEGLPTVANVSFEIKDLYDGMYMSQQHIDNEYGILSNIQELDYIANSCGVNVNDHEIWRTIKMSAALGLTEFKDKVTIGIFGKMGEYFNQKIQNIFGKF